MHAFELHVNLSLVYMHLQCLIFNLNLMPPSQSSHSLYGMGGFFHTFQFFIVHEIKGIFSLLVQVNLVTSIAYKMIWSNYLLVTMAQNAPSSNCGGHGFNTLKSIFAFILFICCNHFHYMTSPP